RWYGAEGERGSGGLCWLGNLGRPCRHRRGGGREWAGGRRDGSTSSSTAFLLRRSSCHSALHVRIRRRCCGSGTGDGGRRGG
ncbi:Os08g0454600, partial [Oryza sativa Japonica Group]